MQDTGKWIILVGVVLVIVGSIWYFLGDKLSFIGNLPGDIRYESDNFRFYFPFTTMVLISVIINVIIRIYNYLLS
ncbi:MAG TPA: DUF2905 domain-containing protein [Saprospiraceae bacterium]|nr:DUF2905 domain-containing protein [Saprospiraceae bacterium]